VRAERARKEETLKKDPKARDAECRMHFENIFVCVPTWKSGDVWARRGEEHWKWLKEKDNKTRRRGSHGIAIRYVNIKGEANFEHVSWRSQKTPTVIKKRGKKPKGKEGENR